MTLHFLSRFLVLGLALALAASIIACGGGADGESGEGAASGAVIIGTIHFNGLPLPEFTDKTPDIWAFPWGDGDWDSGDYPEIETSYDGDTGEYQLAGLPPGGEYTVGFYVDAAEPFDGELGFPYDLADWVAIEVPEFQATARSQIHLPQVIHLLTPVDSSTPLLHPENAVDSYAGPLLFAWEAIEEAVSYEVRVTAYRDDDHFSLDRQVVLNESTPDTSLEVALPPSGAGEWYGLELSAYNQEGQHVGHLLSNHGGGWWFHYDFRIVESSDDS